MKVEFSDSNPDNFPWLLLVIWTLVWLGVLFRILTRNDFDTPAKILWVLVVIFVPFFGVFLYWLAAPRLAKTAMKDRPIESQSDVAGTPWANNSSYRRDT